MANEQEPIRPLSSFVARGAATEAIIKSYLEMSKAVSQKQEKTREEIDFIEDTLSSMGRIALSSMAAAKKGSQVTGTSTSRPGSAAEVSQKANVDKPQTIKLNELVLQPDFFDGEKLNPREWIESFDDAITLNGWSDAIAIKYFPFFLRDGARAWYKMTVLPKLDLITKWDEIRQLFTSQFLNSEERRTLIKKRDELKQKFEESVATFIPKVWNLQKLINPKADEAEVVELIQDKLLPEFHTPLTAYKITTIEELLNTCLKVEAGVKRTRDYYNNRRNKINTPGNFRSKDKAHMDRKDEGRKPDGPKSSTQKSKSPEKGKKCFRCGRNNHLVKNCVATTKLDGTPIKDEDTSKNSKQPKATWPKKEPKVNMVSDCPRTEFNSTARVETSNSVLTVWSECNESCELNMDAEVEDDFNNWIASVGFVTNEMSKKMLCHKILCNNIEFEALIDTGAYNSVIDEKIAIDNDWILEQPAPVLKGAGENRLITVGTTYVKLEISVGSKTKRANIHLVVVKNLGTDFLLGLQVISLFKILIDASSRRIDFKEDSKIAKTPVRLAEATMLAPRSQQIADITVESCGLVLTIPFSYDRDLLIANSIAEVNKNRAQILVLNPTNQYICLDENYEIGTFEKLEEEESADSENIFRIVQLGSSNETVRVGDGLEQSQLEQLSTLLNEHISAFSIDGSIGLTQTVEHQIELIPDAKPFVEPLRRRPFIHVEETRRQIREMLEKDIIEESSSPWASAYVLVKKKTGDFRLCVDFRKLNNLTKKLVYPLPNIEECIDTLAGKKYFSLLDFSSGFWQMPVEKSARELTAFRTEDGLFHFKRMPFGLTNAPASFQRMINALLSGLRGLSLQCFIDDICLASHSWHEHLLLLAKVFRAVIKGGLKLKSSKCTFGANRVVFLGHEISEHGIRQDPDKIRALKELSIPREVSDLRRILGLLGYYRKFVPSFAVIAEPLYKLTRKGVPFVWRDEHQLALRKLIELLEKNLVLSHFNHKDPVLLKTDASKAGVAALLLQKQHNEWRLVCCTSRCLSDAEKNYAITELEALAIINALQKFRIYLLGKKFQIVTDHSALKVFNTGSPQNDRLKRWALLLSEFDFEIIYTKGSLHADVDCLSRAPVDGPDRYLEERIFLIEKILSTQESSCEEIVAAIAQPTNLESWCALYDDEAKQMIEKARVNEDDMNLRNGIIYKGSKLYVPLKERDYLIRAHHASPISNHPGITPTLIRMRLYWWPEMLADVKKFVDSCSVCQLRKVERAKPAGDFNSFEVYEPNMLVAVDYLGPSTETLRMNKFIIVAIDCFTRFVEAKAVQSTDSASFVEFLIEYFGRYGVPKKLLTDNARTFTNSDVRNVAKLFGVEHVTSTPRHSRGNAIVERALQTLQERLSLRLSETNDKIENWDTVLPVVVLALNSTYHKSIGYSPYEMQFGRELPIRSNLVETVETTAYDLHVKLLKKQLAECHYNAGAMQARAKESSREHFERGHRHVEFQKDDIVLIKAPGRGSKFQSKFSGPYKIIEKNRDIYELFDEKSQKKLSRHVSQLKKYRGNINMLLSAIILMLFSVQLVVGQLTLNRATPTAWAPLDLRITKMRVNYDLKLMVNDPCDSILKINWTESVLKESKNQCRQFYKQKIETELVEIAVLYDSISKKRPYSPLGLTKDRDVERRRRRAVIEFISGWVVSNLLNSFINTMTPQEPEPGFQALHTKLQELNSRANLTELALKETANSFKELELLVRKQEIKIDEATAKVPKLMATISHLYSKIESKSSSLKRIRHLLASRGLLDLQAFGEFLDTREFEYLDEETVQVLGIDSHLHFNPYETELEMRFIFRANKRDPDITLYEIRSINHWVDLLSKPRLVEYSGHKYALYNSTSKCVRGFDTLSRNNKEQKCDKPHFVQGNFDSWTDKLSGNPFDQPAQTQVIESYPEIIVNCFTLNITIFEETFPCPSFTFYLNPTIRWNTSDYVFAPFENVSISMPLEWEQGQILNNLYQHTNSSKVTGEIASIKKVFELTSKLEELEKANIAIASPDGQTKITYPLLTRALTWLSILLLACVATAIFHIEVKGRRRHKKMMSHLSQHLIKKNEGKEMEMEPFKKNDDDEEDNDDDQDVRSVAERSNSAPIFYPIPPPALVTFTGFPHVMKSSSKNNFESN